MVFFLWDEIGIWWDFHGVCSDIGGDSNRISLSRSRQLRWCLSWEVRHHSEDGDVLRFLVTPKKDRLERCCITILEGFDFSILGDAIHISLIGIY